MNTNDEENPDIAELRARTERAEQTLVSVYERLAALESQEFILPYDPFRHPDRDLRERLLESALRGVNVSGLHRSEAELIGKASVWMVDAAIDAMRKGES